MIGKPVALIQVPNQRLFSTAAAAKYLGIHANTLRKYADLGWIKARRLTDGKSARRVFTLEELDRFIEALSRWYDGDGEKPGLSRRIGHGNL